MTGESIICFAKEWGQHPTSCDHVFEQLARGNKILWINSVATRTPNLSSAHDWRRILRKVRRILGGLQQVGPTAWVYQPLVIPLPYSEWARRMNRFLLRWSLNRQLRKLRMQRPQVWSFIPNVVDLVDTVQASVVVYYCVDLWSKFGFVEGDKLAVMEKRLAAKSDLCFGTAHSLVEFLKGHNPNSFLALHGVDHSHFARALDEGLPIPDDIGNLPRPVIGFFGAIHEWMDLPLIARMARQHPEWSVVLIGKVEAPTEVLQGLQNVHLLGPRPYESLPAYCKAFAVGMIPFVINELTYHINPIKLREYLSAGLPVVSTELPEVRQYGRFTRIGRSPEDFIGQVESALSEDTPEKRRERSEALRHETWEEVVERVCEQVMRVKAGKAR